MFLARSWGSLNIFSLLVLLRVRKTCVGDKNALLQLIIRHVKHFFLLQWEIVRNKVMQHILSPSFLFATAWMKLMIPLPGPGPPPPTNKCPDTKDKLLIYGHWLSIPPPPLSPFCEGEKGVVVVGHALKIAPGAGRKESDCGTTTTTSVLIFGRRQN